MVAIMKTANLRVGTAANLLLSQSERLNAVRVAWQRIKIRFLILG